MTVTHGEIRSQTDIESSHQTRYSSSTGLPTEILIPSRSRSSTCGTPSSRDEAPHSENEEHQTETGHGQLDERLRVEFESISDGRSESHPGCDRPEQCENHRHVHRMLSSRWLGRDPAADQDGKSGKGWYQRGEVAGTRIRQNEVADQSQNDQEDSEEHDDAMHD